MDGFSKKIVLVNPPSPAGKTLNREGSAGAGAVVESEGGFVYPPQTIASVGAALCQSGFNVEVVDAVKPAVGFDKAVAAVVSSKPEVVGFLATVKTIEYDLEFARAVHRVLPDRRLISVCSRSRQAGRWISLWQVNRSCVLQNTARQEVRLPKRRNGRTNCLNPTLTACLRRGGT